MPRFFPKWFIMTVVTLVGAACHGQSEISYDPIRFKLENEGMTFDGQLFSGVLVKENGPIIRRTPYQNGQIHGVARFLYSATGQLAREMPYEQGQKVGEHRSFYPSGQLRSHATYKNGQYDGGLSQWHRNGQMYSYTLYAEGKLIGHKLWRENGRIYSNYVYQNGRKIGLDGGKLCFTAKDQVEGLEPLTEEF